MSVPVFEHDIYAWQMWVVLAVTIAAIVSYCLERVLVEVTSIAVLAFLLIFFHFFPVVGPEGVNQLGPTALLQGFGNPALVAILALLVVGQGLFQTGAFERPTRWLLSFKVAPGTKLVVVLILVMVVSAFLNNTPVVVMFIPILSAMALASGRSDGEVMMPLSFVCVLGGMTTLIGSSTNLLVAHQYFEAFQSRIGFFDFTGMGLVLAAVGLVYVLVAGRYLLPKHVGQANAVDASQGKQFVAQFRLGANHPLVGVKSRAGLFPNLPNMTIRMIQRRSTTFLPPFDDVELQAGDMIVVATTRAVLTEFLTKSPNHQDIVVGVTQYFPTDDTGGKDNKPRGLSLVEAVVAPGSRMINRPLAQAGFLYASTCQIVGVQRRSRMIRSRIDEIRLEAGDILLVYGPQTEIRALRSNRDLILLEWSATELPIISHANRARVIFFGMLLCAATGLVPIAIASVAAASVMVMLGCLNVRQAIRAIDQRIFLLIGSALALGLALEQTGAAAFLAHSLVGALMGAGQPVILSAFFLLVVLLTNVLSNNATAVLMTPIAINTATQLGVDPHPFVFTVIFAANCSFATPISYQTNLLVMGPGRYGFFDYLKFGGPLILLLWLVFTFVSPYFFAKY